MAKGNVDICLLDAECRAHQSVTNFIFSGMNQKLDSEAAEYLRTYLQQINDLDSNGSSALHYAASTGKIKTVKYLVENRADVNIQDLTFNYTPLHRAFYYGNINIAQYLIKHGARLDIVDNAGLTPLGMECRSFPRQWHDRLAPQQLFVWGCNAYYTLGQFDGASPSSPRRLELFKREENSVCDVAMSKYRTVFVTKNGAAYYCGVGAAGESVATPQLQCCGDPDTVIIKAAVGETFSMFLTSQNKLLMCGQFPGSERNPKEGIRTSNMRLICTSTFLKFPREPILGIFAAKYHTGYWTNKYLYTFGVNAGQLGYSRSCANTITEPKAVVSLEVKDAHIQSVGTSLGATVVAYDNGDIYCLNEYHVKTITTVKGGHILKICCTGGSLDDKVDEIADDDKVMGELQIVVLYSDGQIFLWTQSQRDLCLISFINRSDLLVSDVCLHKSGFGIATREGEVYRGSFSPFVVANTYLHGVGAPLFRRRQLRNPAIQKAYVIQLRTLRRAASVYCDPEGKNFASLQYHPRSFSTGHFHVNNFVYNQCPGDIPEHEQWVEAPHSDNDGARLRLLNDCREGDGICDMVFVVQTSRFPAHRFIVSRGSATLAELILHKSRETDANHLDSSTDDAKPVILEIEFLFDPVIFPTLLRLLYLGRFGRRSDRGDGFAYKYYNDSAAISQKEFNDVFRELRLNRANLLYWETFRNSMVAKKELDYGPQFQDVQFSCHGQIIKANKCMLLANSQYFEMMLGNSAWLENASTAPIKMSFGPKVFQIIMDYLHSCGEKYVPPQSVDFNFFCDVYAAADQLLLTGLTTILETKLANLLTLKNCLPLLEFSELFNAARLRGHVYTFILFNVVTLMETGLLDNATEDQMAIFTDYYRELSYCERINYLNSEPTSVPFNQQELQPENRPKNFDNVRILAAEDEQYTFIQTQFSNVARTIYSSSISPKLPVNPRVIEMKNLTGKRISECEASKTLGQTCMVHKPSKSRRSKKKTSSEPQSIRNGASLFASWECPSRYRPMKTVSCRTFSKQTSSFSGLQEKTFRAAGTEWKIVDTKKRKSLPTAASDPIALVEDKSSIQNQLPVTPEKISDYPQQLAAAKSPEKSPQPPLPPGPPPSPPPPPPPIEDADIFPSLLDSTEKRKNHIYNTKMPRGSFKSHRKLSSVDVSKALSGETGLI